MTAGTSGSPNMASPPNPGTTYQHRVWSGGDGKYESYDYALRAKWNSYSVVRRSARTDGLIVYRCPGTEFYPSHTLSYALENTGFSGIWSAMATYFPKISDSQNINRLSKLLGKIRGHEFNLAVSASQAHQFTGMVVGNLSKLGRSIMALKRGDFATAARQLGATPRPTRLKANDIGGRWLELQYGWLPTISDTYEAAKAFEAISSGPKRTRFSAEEKEEGNLTFTNLGAASDAYVSNIKYGRRYTFEMYEELGFERQLGLLDPLSVLWENVPYSFVVDWFIPIGDYLSVLNQIPSLNGRWMITDYAQWRDGKPKYSIPGPIGYCPYHPSKQMTVEQSPTVTCACDQVSRSNSGPSLAFPKVKVLGAVHGRRIANALALAAGRFLS